MTLSLTTRRLSWSGASAPAPEVAQLEVVPPIAAVPFEAAPPFVVERSFEAEPLQPVAAVIMAADTVIRATNIAVAPPMLAVFIVAARSQAVLFVAVRTPEVALLPAVEAHMSPTAVADAVGNK